MGVPGKLVSVGIATLLLVAACGYGTDEPEAPDNSPTVTSPSTAPPSTPPPHTTGPNPSPDPTTPTPTADPVSVEDAIRVWLSDNGIVYAGPCELTSLSDDIGKYCSAVLEDRGATVVAWVGPTFSEFTTYLLIERSGDGWVVTQVAPVPPPDENGGEHPPF